jgi:hypothetical protein
VGGKLIRRSLKTAKLFVAKPRLGDTEKAERQKVEWQTSLSSGATTFGQALVIYRQHIRFQSGLNH